MQKIISLFILFTVSTQYVQAQTDTLHYYVDEDEKRVEQKQSIYHIKVYKEKVGDNFWKRDMYRNYDNTLESTGSSKDQAGEIKHGTFTLYDFYGNKHESGRYEDGKKEGEWLRWNDEGKKLAVKNYTKGVMTGLNKSWHEDGNILDSLVLDRSGNGTGYGFYSGGIKKYEGKFSAGLKTGTWTYFYNDRNNPRSMEVSFEADSAVTSKCFDLDGKPMKKNCFFEKEAIFPGGDKAWKKYLVKKLTAADYDRYIPKNVNVYRVVVRFVVTADGTLGDIKVEKSGIKQLDQLAVDIITDSPEWEPAMQYNQPVKAYRRQPLTFMVSN